jgi:NAD(P)-dependent dehydrogenase (short-subunit alcohol dehydrogenase family)
MATFDGKVAIVTGGTSGIGRETALAFAREGAKVVVAGRRDAEGNDTVRAIRQVGGVGEFVKTDVSLEADVRALVERAVAAFGRLDCAFNNAGIEQPGGAVDQQTGELFDRLYEINVKGTWLCLKYQIPAMLRTGGGAIVNNASASGLVGVAGMALYSATKHAVIGLTRSAAIEYAKAGVRINVVCPGAISTEMIARFAEADPRAVGQVMASHPIGRMGTPAEVASAVLWLCSAGGGFVVGHALAVDGGYVAG